MEEFSRGRQLTLSLPGHFTRPPRRARGCPAAHRSRGAAPWFGDFTLKQRPIQVLTKHLEHLSILSSSGGAP